MKLIAFIFVSVLLLSCSRDSSTSGISNLESMPKATGATTASSSISKNVRSGELQSATTGTQLDAWYTAFNTNLTSKSQTFCQLGLVVKEVIKAASQPDKIACYLGVMEKHASVSGWPSGSADGNYHYINLSGAGGGDGKIKFKINTSGGVYTGFEMFSGFGGNVQTEYISLANTNGSISLTSVQFYTDGSNTSRGRVTATGTVNSSGVWTSAKSIVGQATRSETNRSQNARIELTQYSDRIQVQGYDAGTETNSGTFNYTNAVYALVQVLTPNPLSTFALGEGTAKISMTRTGQSAFSNTRAWNGDTQAPISDPTTADYYATVNAATVPSAPASYDTTFATAEQWDLAPPAGTTATAVDFANIQANAAAAADFAACNTAYGFSEESNWPNCWSGSDN